MLAYVLLVLIPMVYFGILQAARNRSGFRTLPGNNSILKVFFLIYFLLLALRSTYLGVDVPNYVRKFRYAGYLPWKEWFNSSSFEMGFMFLTKLISMLTDHKQIYLAIVAGIIVFPVSWFYSRESEGPILTMALFLILPLFGMFFSGLRQAIAVAMAVPAYCFVRDKKWIKFIFIVLAAMQFHISAFILFGLYPVYHAKLSKKALLWILPGILVIYLYSGQIFSYLLVVLSFFYADSSWGIKETGAYSMLILFAGLMVFSFVFMNENEDDPEILGMRNILVLAVVLQCFASVNPLAMRMNYYFLLFLPLLIPKVIRRASGDKALICQGAGVIMCLYFFYYFFSQVYNQQSSFRIFPYAPFWKG